MRPPPMSQSIAFRNKIPFIHRTSAMAFCDGEVRDADDRLIAKAMGTFKYLKQERPA